ncbi:MAG: NUDIX domain-containing protein [Neisseria sp.]|uniref:NUDIX domain-containing protein n=1 Tax=Neisseria sp. TaxID=192066 RepID=UPI0026DAC6A6|nr:NUDIX domain-containing protein [Neisseria sp.]MDO4641583.1 NUDIX domain-containing protein [Neisseria sp.]
METSEDSLPLLYVVAGVVLNEAGDYLLASRPEGKPYAGYWEFAGGKVEPGESELEALRREFEEELGIHIHHATPWLTKIHAYEHARVHLRFFRVRAKDWSGHLQAREGQQWSWQRAGDFTVSPMLPANGPLLAALAVPTELQGSVEHGFTGENRVGEYRVVPFALWEPTHHACLISESELGHYGRRPQAESVWVIIENAAQLVRVPDADVLVWSISSDLGVEQLFQVLREGVGVPLVVLAQTGLSEKYRDAWLEAGAHAVVTDSGTGLV